jgi:hypothetical protein
MGTTRIGAAGPDLVRLFEVGAAGPQGDAEASLRCEAEGLLARVVAEYGDVVQAGRDPGDPKFPLWTVSRAIGEEAAGRPRPFAM